MRVGDLIRKAFGTPEMIGLIVSKSRYMGDWMVLWWDGDITRYAGGLMEVIDGSQSR